MSIRQRHRMLVAAQAALVASIAWGSTSPMRPQSPSNKESLNA